MTTLAKVVALLTAIAGYGSLAWGLLGWQSTNPSAFAAYLVAATAATAVQIGRTSSRGPLSPHLFVLLLALPQLSFGEVAVIAAVGALPQALRWQQSERPGWSTALDVATLLTATGIAYLAYFWLTHSGGAPGLATDLSSPLTPLALVLAGLIYGLVRSLLSELFAQPGKQASRKPSWGEIWSSHHFWTLPHYAISGAAAGLTNLVWSTAGWKVALMVIPLLAWMYYSYRNHLSGVDEQRQQVRDLHSLHLRTIETLSLAIEAHDPTKRTHLRRLGIYVRDLAQRLGLHEEEMEALEVASLLHDIGKIAVPGHLFSKADQLTAPEFERIKTHVDAGAEILNEVQFPYPVVPIVRAHHEKWDGTGYPLRLKGEQIPMGARILAVVDCLDALMSDREYRPASTLSAAVEYIKSQSSKSFDPQVVDLLVSRYQELEARVAASFSRDQNGARLQQIAQTEGQTGTPRPASDEFLVRIAAAKLEEQQLFRLARELGNSLSLSETLEACAGHLRHMIPWDAIAISIRRGSTLETAYASGLGGARLAGMKIPVGAATTGSAASSGTPILNGPAETDLSAAGLNLEWFEFPNDPGELVLRSALAVPLKSPSGVIGVVTLYTGKLDGFQLDHLRILTAVAAKAALSVENAMKYTQAERSATTDNLTELPNARSLFLHLDSELARARRENYTVSVLVCDLDGFKAVNDRLGHIEGNRVLQMVAQTLKRQCREYDFVGRMGGDEFVVVMSGYRPAALQSKMDQLTAAVQQTGLDLGLPHLGVSIGEASHPDDGENAESLLAEADHRMYAKKRRKATGASEDRDNTGLHQLRRSISAGDVIH